MPGEATQILRKARSLLMINQHALHFSPFFSSLSSSLSAAASFMSTATTDAIPNVVSDQKRALRSRIRRDLKAFPPAHRAQEDKAIQDIVLSAPWFKSSSRLCAYISCEALREVDTSRILSEALKTEDASCHTQVIKKLYVPRVEDRNSHMRMLNLLSMEDLVANSMNIMEPSPVDANGNQVEDVMLANHPVDIFLLPGLAFDRQGRRLGRGGGYYDVLLKRYQELALARKWEQPLLIALTYYMQILEDGVIPVTPTDVLVDALVSPSGVTPVSSAAAEKM